MSKKKIARPKPRTKKAPQTAEQPSALALAVRAHSALTQLDDAHGYLATDARSALVKVVAAYGSNEASDMLDALSELARLIDVADLCVHGAAAVLKGEASDG